MSDNTTIDERLAFMGLDGATRSALKSVRPLIENELKPALDAFYAKVRATPKTQSFFKSESHIASASGRQQAHWNLISSGEFDASYVTAVRTLGQTHARIGLEPRWFIGGYALIADHLIRRIIEIGWPKWSVSKSSSQALGAKVGAVVKAALLDIDIGISVYLETIEAERQRLDAIRIKTEESQAIVVAALGEALERLSKGDLKSHVSCDMSPEFQKLKDDFNQAVDVLSTAMMKVTNTTQAISSGADQIGAAADDLSRRTEHQAASLEETAAALDEITATVRRTAEGQTGE